MIKKLRRKFIIIATSVIIAVLGFHLGMLNLANYVRIDKNADKILNILTENNGVMPLPPFDNNNSPANELSPEVPFKTRYFTVTLNKNQIVQTNVSKIAAISKEQANDFALSLNKLEKDKGYHNGYKFTKITVENGQMYIFLDCVNDLESAKKVLTSSLTIGLLIVILIFILIWIFSYIAIKPIAESYEKQKRFITDANHEIKTPLAIINATNEVMEIEFGKNEWSDTITKQIRKLNDLTEKLVFLSRMDEENANIQKETFNLSNTVTKVAEPFYHVAKSSKKEFNLVIEPNLEYFGDSSLIGQLCSILLENAFKYSKEGGKIDFSLQRQGNSTKITVGNTADNLDKKNIDKLFDRFYRPDESRNSQTGGNGIGLSIAKSIVNIHKGKITATVNDDEYITFIVTL